MFMLRHFVTEKNSENEAEWTDKAEIGKTEFLAAKYVKLWFNVFQA